MAKKMTPMFDDSLPVSPARKTSAKTPAPKPAQTSISEDPYYKRDPRTGLSPAQVDAQNAAKETAASVAALGIPAKFTPGEPGMAGRITVKGPTGPTLGTGQTGPTLPAGGLTAADVETMLADFYKTLQKDALAEKRATAESAYSLLFDEFNRYGLGALVTPLQRFIQDGISPAEFTIRLRDTDAYKRRFAANQQRINQGLRALSEAEYIELEDSYQNIMRQYGMPDTYYRTEKDPVTGITLQPGFEKFIAGDVSPAELEDRVQTAYNRVLKANPEVMNNLKSFYGDVITNGDILAYALDTKNAIENIKRKVTAAEIGAGAQLAGLGTTRARAEELGAFGVTGAAAREKFQAVAEVLPRGSQLAEIYKQTPYTQTTAEQEVFGLGGAVEAGRQRRKLTELEQASFAGQSGMAGGALARDRAGAF